MHINISKRFFNAEYYRKVYNVTADNLWDYWVKSGLPNNHICYKLKLDLAFDHAKYKEDIGIDMDIDCLYHNWFVNGKKKKYIKKNTITKNVNNTMDISCFNTSVEQVFSLYTAFDKVYSKDRICGLRKIAKISKNNPNIKINEALEKYLSI